MTSDLPESAMRMKRADLAWGSEGETRPGARRGLPAHIDGVPVVRRVPVLHGGRHGSSGRALPMFELREDDDQPNRLARWPEPFGSADLDELPW